NRDLNHSMSLGNVSKHIYSAVFAYEGPQKQTFKKNVMDYYKNTPDIEKVANVICVLDEYVALRQNGSLHFVDTGQDSLNWFFTNISSAAYKNFWGQPDLQSYSNSTKKPQF
ncbi:MAG TPA: hypothetical protein VFJ06_09470, partial [Halococcus sp.]|nr:hypothetical protein [Halococcus sp.]